MNGPNETSIGWTDRTWNPVHGCSHVSPGCDNCYAERTSRRWGQTKLDWTGENAKENVQLKSIKLKEPYKLKNPSRVFVNSMSDTFHPQVQDSFLDAIFEVMNGCPQHTFQVLTKRPRRAAKWWGPWGANVWLGVSVENRDVLHRIDTLRSSGAKVRFLSIEPLLERLGKIDLSGIDWVIVGGESGPGYRPMSHAWAREIRDQCVDAGVPFFFKQSAAFKNEMGKLLIEEDGTETEWRQFPDADERIERGGRLLQMAFDFGEVG